MTTKTKATQERSTELVALEMRLRALIEKHADIQRTHLGSGIAEQIEFAMQHYHDLATNTLGAHKTFVEDMLVMLRALSMVLEMVGNAGTHREKGARLRGCVELIETSIEKLRKQEFDMSYQHRFLPDIFRSDYPVRNYMERIRELEAKLEAGKTA